jgi:hypothetical protein
MQQEKTQILLVGADEFNLEELSYIDNRERYEFIPRFDPKEIQQMHEYDIRGIEKKLEEVLVQYDIRAIISFFNFPFSLMAHYLSEKRGFRGPSLLSSLKCHHKYWSRVEQQRCVPENVPAFENINPFNPTPWDELNLPPVFWLKPVKSHASKLGFRIESKKDYEQALIK